jgi:hypothetical protein
MCSSRLGDDKQEGGFIRGEIKSYPPRRELALVFAYLSTCAHRLFPFAKHCECVRDNRLMRLYGWFTRVGGIHSP